MLVLRARGVPKLTSGYATGCVICEILRENVI